MQGEIFRQIHRESHRPTCPAGAVVGQNIALNHAGLAERTVNRNGAAHQGALLNQGLVVLGEELTHGGHWVTWAGQHVKHHGVIHP